MFEIVSALVGLAILLSIAFPHIVFPAGKGKKKKVGSVYWGVYDGASVKNQPGEKEIEIPAPARKCNEIAGSAMYASGKGTSFRR
jgi:hypothetical protein